MTAEQAEEVVMNEGEEGYPWNHHPENQVREIVDMGDGSLMERMYFPRAVCPTYSYRPLAEGVSS